MAHTGLAVLAFQAGGYYYFNDTRYSAAVRKALDWIVEHQKDDGALVGSLPVAGPGGYHQYYMYEHGMATFALGDACAAALALHEPPAAALPAESSQGREVHRAEPAPRRRLALRRRALGQETMRYQRHVGHRLAGLGAGVGPGGRRAAERPLPGQRA